MLVIYENQIYILDKRTLLHTIIPQLRSKNFTTVYDYLETKNLYYSIIEEFFTYSE